MHNNSATNPTATLERSSIINILHVLSYREKKLGEHLQISELAFSVSTSGLFRSEWVN